MNLVEVVMNFVTLAMVSSTISKQMWYCSNSFCLQVGVVVSEDKWLVVILHVVPKSNNLLCYIKDQNLFASSDFFELLVNVHEVVSLSDLRRITLRLGKNNLL